jgi:hypothetical protein
MNCPECGCKHNKFPRKCYYHAFELHLLLVGYHNKCHDEINCSIVKMKQYLKESGFNLLCYNSCNNCNS